MSGRNVAASVAARLLNRSKETGDDYQTLLTSFALERFLYRLGVSDLRDRFVLKGAMLLRLWSDQPYRATRDLDLLRQGSGTLETTAEEIQIVAGLQVPPDGISFDADRVTVEVIRATEDFNGARATLAARCGNARLTAQIDVGLGDAVWPAPERCVYPSLLDLPAPTVLVYPREAVVAEKLEAIVVLGDRNSRIKDFFDLHYLASRFGFDRETLTETIRRTFARRRTPFPGETPLGLTSAYWENPSRPAQVRAFLRRAGLQGPEEPGEGVTTVIGPFLAPILDDLREGRAKAGHWPPGGPWTAPRS